MLKRTKIIFGLILLLLITSAPFFYLRMSDPVLVVEGQAPYLLYVNNEAYEITTDQFEVKLKEGTYALNFVKANFSANPIVITLERKNEKIVYPEFIFEPQLQEVSELEMPEKDYFLTSKCPNRISTGSGAITYCYLESEKGTLLKESPTGKSTVLTELMDMPDVTLTLNRDKTLLLVSQTLEESGKAYLINLDTGFKQKLWENEYVLNTKFSEDSQYILFERVIGEFMYEMVPVEVVILNLKDLSQEVIDKRVGVYNMCLTGQNLFWLQGETKEEEIKLESLADLVEELGQTFSGDVNYVDFQTLSKIDLETKDEEALYSFEPETAWFSIVTCSENQVSLVNELGETYRIALEESAMED
ncbi:MAG: hypothetical protein PHU71_00230 [Candidatus Gracilibacteria bacterium]|nr:hypothetical protein [Candidatus Gracilibacteria bacterium]